ncbi:unnamed protein product [Cylicocyclus nassatus]|uniref:Uncharacterized protein n=1 Tax=Cylicocyclus nassatus TaxID=53992 RepID=A0AA36M2Y4_CYLNA|nr:unnamed protein product [Cylicocyclus nassatus]
MNHDFGRVPLTDAPRSTFDRSHGYKTCFNSGKLIPIEVQEVLPGDEVKMDANIFARLSQTVTPVMDNVFLDIHCGEYGFDIGSLADYFGIPTGVANLDVNVLPFRAYAKIWDDWYRDTNLQDSIINVEQDLGDSNPNSIDWNKLLPRGKKKDYFTSCLPSPQRGDAVTVPLGSTAPVYGINGVPLQLVSYDTTDPSYSDKVFPVKATGGGESSTLSATNNPEYGGTGDALNGQYLRIASKGELVSYPAQLEADLSAAANVSVNSLRTAFQLQRLLETDARAGNRLQRSEYLGGESKIIGMSVVSQTSATGDSTTPQGNMVANGTNGYNPLLALSSSAPHFQGSATAPSFFFAVRQSGGAASAGSFGSAVGAISSAVGGLGNLVKLGSELGLNSALSSKALADTRLSESSAALNAAKTAEINQSLPYRLRNLQYRGELGETVNTVRNAYEEAATAVRGFGGRVADSVNSVGASSAKALKQVSDKVRKTLDEGKGFFRNLGSRYLRNMDLMRMPLR